MSFLALALFFDPGRCPLLTPLCGGFFLYDLVGFADDAWKPVLFPARLKKDCETVEVDLRETGPSTADDL